MKSYIYFTVYFFFFFFGSISYASTYNLSDYFADYLFEPKKRINHPTLEFYYGVSLPAIPKIDFNDKFENAYQTGVKYGFTRFDNIKNMDNFTYLSGEYAFFEDISSHLNIANSKSYGLTLENFRFGFSSSSGIGKIISDKFKIIPTHTASVIWSRMDIEQDGSNSINTKYIKDFDEIVKFGSSFSPGINFQYTDFFTVKINYDQTLVYSNFEFWKWTGSLIIDNVLQKTPEIFEPLLVDMFGEDWMILRFIYKNAVSYGMNSIRKKRTFFPFASNYAMVFDTFSISVMLTF